MIYDQFQRLSLYRNLSRNFAIAIDYLNTTALDTLADGRYPIAGEDVIAIVMQYKTKSPADAIWESHRRHADLQLMTDGAESMAVRDVTGLIIQTPYDAENDRTFYVPPAPSVTLHVRANEFAIFLPHDAHQPSVMLDQPAMIRKIVMKIAV